MITKSDILHTIEDKGEAEIKSIIGYYITEIKRERPDLLLYEINELYKDVLKWSDFYQNMRESKEFLDHVKEQQRLFPGYSRGRDVNRYVANYNIALQIVTFLLPGDEKKKPLTPKVKTQTDQNYSQRQIAIAYFIIGDIITIENASRLLIKHSQTRNAQKLVSKRIGKASELTSITSNKTTDTKHLHDLHEAKRLLSGIKNTNAVRDLTTIIQTFESKYRLEY